MIALADHSNNSNNSTAQPLKHLDRNNAISLLTRVSNSNETTSTNGKRKKVIRKTATSPISKESMRKSHTKLLFNNMAASPVVAATTDGVAGGAGNKLLVNNKSMR